MKLIIEENNKKALNKMKALKFNLVNVTNKMKVLKFNLVNVINEWKEWDWVGLSAFLINSKPPSVVPLCSMGQNALDCKKESMILIVSVDFFNEIWTFWIEKERKRLNHQRAAIF